MDCLRSGLLACMIVSVNCPSTKDLMSLNAKLFSCTFAFERKNKKLACGHVRYAVAEWVRHYATNRQVTGSIPNGVIGIFQ